MPGGFFFESALSVDGSAVSFDTDAVRVAFGFGASAGGGVESVEAGRGGGVAIGSPSGLIACAATDGAVVFGASARSGVELGEAEAEADGAVASGDPSGLIACEAADGAAVFGASARGGAESGEAGVDGAVAIGAPSGPILCEVTSVAAWLGGAGMTAGAAERGELEGSAVCSFCGPTRLSVAATEGSRSGRSGAWFRRAKLTQIVAAPASASPPAISFQLRELGLVDF